MGRDQASGEENFFFKYFVRTELKRYCGKIWRSFRIKLHPSMGASGAPAV